MTETLWFSLHIALLLLMGGLIIYALLNSARELLWFYIASIFFAMLFAYFERSFFELLGALTSWNENYSLLSIVSTISFDHVLRQLLVFIGLFFLESVVLFLLVSLYSAFSGHLKRLTFFLRSLSQILWQALSFAFLTTLFFLLQKDLGVTLDAVFLKLSILLISFVYLLQLFLRWMDNAALRTSKIFMEFLYVTGILMMLAVFLDRLFFLPVENYQIIFLEHLTMFFLGCLLMGVIGTFFVRAYFSSSFFLDHFSWYIPLMARLVKKYLPLKRVRKELLVTEQHIAKGTLLSFLIVFLFMLLLAFHWTLAVIALLFISYFFLFLFLDRQEDMKIRGEVVESR